MHNFSNLVRKTDYDTKIMKLIRKLLIIIMMNIYHNHDKYITPEFNKLITKTFSARLIEANFVTMTGFDNKLVNFNKRINSNKTKQNVHLLKMN